MAALIASLSLLGLVPNLAPGRYGLRAPALRMEGGPPKMPDFKMPEGMPKLGDLREKLPKDLPVSLDELPEQSQPWVKAYSAQSKLFFYDFAGLMLFAIVGRLTHFENVLNPFADILTALPFLLGYFAAAQPLGAYADDATSDYGKMVKTLAPAWAAGTLGGVTLRAIGKFAAPPLPFVIVTFISTFVFLAGPRAVLVFQVLASTLLPPEHTAPTAPLMCLRKRASCPTSRPSRSTSTEH